MYDYKPDLKELTLKEHGLEPYKQKVIPEERKIRLIKNKLRFDKHIQWTDAVKNQFKTDYHKLRPVLKELKPDKHDLRPNEEEFWPDT